MTQKGAQGEISVNINDWMTRTQRAFNPNDGAHASVIPNDMTPEELIAEADRRQAHYIEAERLRLLEVKLAAYSSLCSECGTQERPYRDDYMCYRCRDKLDS